MMLSDNELKVMEIIWDKNNVDVNGEITAKELSDMLTEKHGWSKNSNYVYFKRLLEKGAITRRYPNYTIRALATREGIVNESLGEMIEQVFDGSVLSFFSGFINDKKVTKKDIEGMKEIIESFDLEDKENTDR